MRSNEIAKLTGTSVRTLRHYHALGLLPEPERSENGYRDYSVEDAARVLRIKQLASLGFPLARVGELLDELDGPSPHVPEALEELDRELEAQIAELKTKRQTIAQLRKEGLSPDLPVRFARAVQALSGSQGAGVLDAPGQRTTLLLASHIYDEQSLLELERVAQRVQEAGSLDLLTEMDQRFNQLDADAPEEERAQMVERSLEALAPLLPLMELENWDRPGTPEDELLEMTANAQMNPAQRDVMARIEEGITDALRERTGSED